MNTWLVRLFLALAVWFVPFGIWAQTVPATHTDLHELYRDPVPLTKPVLDESLTSQGWFRMTMFGTGAIVAAGGIYMLAQGMLDVLGDVNLSPDFRALNDDVLLAFGGLAVSGLGLSVSLDFAPWGRDWLNGLVSGE